MKIFGLQCDNQSQLIIQIKNISTEEQVQSLISLDKFKDSLLANVAHDLRCPLSSMLYLVEESSTNNNLQQINSDLSLALVNGKLLMSLINDILDYCLFNHKKMKFNYSFFYLNELINETIQIMTIQAQLKNISILLVNKLPENLECRSDSRRIQQVLINILGNSIKFTTKGIIKLVVSNNQQNLIDFEIFDQGSGIPKEIKQQLGKPFMTFGNEANTNINGIGLGLNLCKLIINQLGPDNSFCVSSKVGKGSKFCFQLYQTIDSNNVTLSKENESQIQTQNEIFSEFSSINICCDFCSENVTDIIQNVENTYFQEKQLNLFQKFSKKYINHKEEIHSQKLHSFQKFQDQQQSGEITTEKYVNILIADDNVFNKFVLKRQLLKMNPSYKIIEASHGKEAVNYFINLNNKIDERDNIKLIIMDIQMPILNGFQACSMIKNLIYKNNYVNTIVIGITALLDQKEEQMASKVGMKAIFLKPLNSNLLKETLDQLF